MTSRADNSTADLLARSRAGDEDALGQLFHGYRAYLRLLARMEIDENLQAKIDPSDIAQEALLQAHRDFGKFRGDTEQELATWLRNILGTKLGKLIRHYMGTQKRDIYRERENEFDVDRSADALSRLAARRPSPSESVERREDAVRVAAAIEQLPEDYRQVILLRSMKGLPFQQVAGQMERSVGSVEKLWARALVKLKQNLDSA